MQQYIIIPKDEVQALALVDYLESLDCISLHPFPQSPMNADELPSWLACEVNAKILAKLGLYSVEYARQKMGKIRRVLNQKPITAYTFGTFYRIDLRLFRRLQKKGETEENLSFEDFKQLLPYEFKAAPCVINGQSEVKEVK